LNVPSFPLLGFALIVALVLSLSHVLCWRQGVLLAANVYFLSTFSHDLVAFLPFAAFLAIGYAGIMSLRRDASIPVFVLFVGLLLGSFIWLKKYTFIPSGAFLPFPYVLLGLSYVFFRVMHLIIDSRDGIVGQGPGIVSYLNYTLNFTSIVSGPIQRYQDYARMEQQRPTLDLTIAGLAFRRIVVGYFKVAIVSTALSGLQADEIHALLPAQAFQDRVGEGMLIAAIYPLFLYFNFSGYTDFVIGVARFLAVELPENFNSPFSAENFIDFWSRWHMTLSMWLKTYVYNPLLMATMRRFQSARIEPFLSVFAFFVTFFLVGVWHGQTSEFLMFGLLQGAGVAINKLYQISMARRLGRKSYRALCADWRYAACTRGLTFTWFTFTLFWFWSDWDQMGLIAGALGPAGVLLGWVLILVMSTILLSIWYSVRRRALGMMLAGVPVLPSRYVQTMWCTALVVVTVAFTLLLDAPAPDIVYKAF
jgi:alginate O-acetyltransferase complex protein AlgI